MAKYEVSLSIGFAGAKHTDIIDTSELGYTDEEWDALSQKDKDSELESAWTDWSNNYIDGGWREV